MPSDEASELRVRKRQRCAETELATPSSQPWDNLSRQWLIPPTLREFDRRTEHPTTTLPPVSSLLNKDHLTQLKRFARLGGPDPAVQT